MPNTAHIRRMFNMLLVATVFSFSIYLSTSDALAQAYEAQFTENDELIRPSGWREWVFIGSPLTPHSLNSGAAAFPEFHTVYVDPISWEEWKRTGTWREGTMIAKELNLVGATAASSGKGFFNGDLQGLEIAYKNTAKYPNEPNGWAYFSFGHQPEPYEDAVVKLPTAACAACHAANSADDMVFTQYYPIAVAAKAKGAAGSGIGGR